VRLLAKVHEPDVMACPRYGSRMSVIAVIVDPAEIRTIIGCLQRHGRGPPPLMPRRLKRFFSAYSAVLIPTEPYRIAESKWELPVL
jgi:hypothetical protein